MKIFTKFCIRIYLCLMFSLLVSTACSPISVSENAPDPLSFTGLVVSDSGYRNFPDKTPSGKLGASDRAYQTLFTAGDSIGVFGVKNNAVIPEVDNLCLTAFANGDKIGWKAKDAQSRLTVRDGVTYYAYFPYRPDIDPGQVDPTITDADPEAFFGDFIAAWTPPADQGDQTKYSSGDLMVATGVESGTSPQKTLSFTMKHTMAMVVMNFKGYSHYVFDNTDIILPDYVVESTPPPLFQQFTPFLADKDSYHYLINPATSPGHQFDGGYPLVVTRWTFSTPDLPPGHYWLYDIDKGRSIKQLYHLQPGDFFLKDGRLLSKDTPLNQVQRSQVLGVVLNAGRYGNLWHVFDNTTYYQKDGVTPLDIHGYVLALNDADQGNHPMWASDNNKRGNTQRPDNWRNFSGYTNTSQIKASVTSDLKHDFPATYYATDGYESEYPSPDQSTGWYFPCNNEIQLWYQVNHNNKNVILNSLIEATGQSDYHWQNQYWSTLEYGSIYVDVFDMLHGKTGFGDQKVSTDNAVRSMLVF